MSKTEEEKVKLQKYLNRVEAAENFREGYKELWKRCYKRYRNHVDKLRDPQGKEITDRSNISIPYTLVQIETIVPRMVESVFAARPYVALKGREPSDHENAERHETLLDWQMNERVDIKKRFKTGLKEMAMYGTAVAYTGWRYEEREVIRKMLTPVLDDETQQPLFDGEEPILDYQPMKVTETEHDDPDPKFIDLGLFFVDPHAPDIDDARYCGHIEYMSKEQLQKLEELDGYTFDWEEIKNLSTSEHDKARNERMKSVGLPTTNSDNTNSEDNLYEVIRYWEDNKCVMIINRGYIAKDGENPFHHKKKPYVKEVYTEVPREFYGMGVIESIEDLQDELNTERNMRIDFRAFSLRRMWKVRRGANINRAQLKWRQGGIIVVDQMDDIGEVTVDSKIGDSFNQEEIIKKDIQDTTGAHDVVMGTSTSSETATTTMTKDNNASMRFKDVIDNVERLLVGVSRFMIKLNQQYIDDTKVLRVTGEDGDEWDEISPEEIQGEFDLIAMGSSVEPMANKEAYKQRMIELYGVLSNDPLIQGFPNKRRSLLKKLLDSFDIKDTESLLPSDEELGIPSEDTIQQPTYTGPSNTSLMQEQGLTLRGGGLGG
jgi:hypothetical protein